MRISSFHIDGFGLFTNVGGDNLSPALNIFYGQNEAGKSTCLEFFRVMLTGYPDKSSRRRSYEPLRGGRPGGSLTLLQGEREIIVSRAPNSFGGLSLQDGLGHALNADTLTQLLGGVGRDIYCRVFGFSLEELERWDKKSEDSVRNALFGASFGPGLLPPGEVLGRLDKEMGKIFKARGSTQPLAADLAEINALHTRIRQREERETEFNTLAATLKETQSQLAEIGPQKEQLELEKIRLERRLAVRQQWEQWRLLGEKLAKLPVPPAGFPEDARMRLARLAAERDACARDVAAAKETLRQLESRMEQLPQQLSLVADIPLLRRLGERKGEYRRAEKALESLRESCEKSEADLASGLAMLGPQWDCTRIRQTDRSLFAREGMEKRATLFTGARQAHQAATTALAQANEEEQLAQQAVAVAQERLDSLPTPSAPVSEEDRDLLRRSMARLEESRRMAPAREKSLTNAQRAFRRSLEQTQIFPEPPADGDSIQDEETEEKAIGAVDAVLQHQAQAMAIAANLDQSLKALTASAQRLQASESRFSALKGKEDERRSALAKLSGSSRQAIESRAHALRQLRQLGSAIGGEEERQKELEAAIARLKGMQPARNFTLVGLGTVLLACAVIIGIAWYFLGLDRLDLGHGLYIPVNLWAGYICLFCGVLLFASGFSAHAPEQRRQRQELAQLLARREASSMRLAELGLHAQQLCETENIDGYDPITIDTLEMLLESDKERLFHEEQSGRELDAMEQELTKVQEEVESLRRAAHEDEQAVQQGRRQWHDLMQGLQLGRIPSAESAATMFARLEAAKVAWENVQNARRESDFLWEDLHQTEETITGMEVIQKILQSAPEALSLEQAVTQALAACREADLASQQRQQVVGELSAAEAALAAASRRRSDAYARLEEAASALAAARHEWGVGLEALSFDGDMDPETMREAYKQMDACLALEDRLQAYRQALADAERDIDAFQSGVKGILVKLDREAPAAGAVDWASLLDELLAEADEQRRAAQRRQDLQENIQRQRETVESLVAAQATAEREQANLLAQGESQSVDEFLARASVRDERRELAARKAESELLLSQGAHGEPLDAFLESFQRDDPAAQELRVMQIRDELGRLGDAERVAAERVGQLQAQLDILAQGDELLELRQQEAILRESIRRQADRWEELALARELLLQARAIFERDRQPAIIREASTIFEQITGGRWRGLSLNLEDSSLLVLGPAGQVVSPLHLSRGAQEQAYLAIRLAFIREHSRNHNALPLIMDEVLVNFDPERARNAALAFANLAVDGEQQILYFTCQPQTVAMLRDVFGSAALYELKDGQITRTAQMGSE